MKRLVSKRFRCDLCGKFRTVGVTETDPREPTHVCFTCVAEALEVMACVSVTAGPG